MSEVQRYAPVSPELATYLTQQRTGGGEVHLHYHAAPEPVRSAAPLAAPAPDVLARYTPYLVLGVFALFGVAAVCAVLVIAGPIIVALLGSVVAIVVAAGASVLAVGMAAVMLGNATERIRGPKPTGKRPGKQ